MPATECRSLGRGEWIAAVGKFLACASGFLALSFLFCYPAGMSSSVCILSGDALAAYFPYLLRSFQPVSSNVAGPWDPTILTGLPESHSPYGVYYPLTILLYHLLPAGQALSLSLVLHHALAGLGAYVLARTSRLSRSAAWLAGIVFGFGGFMVYHRGHLTIQYSAAWLPWILWGLERFRISGSLIWVVVTGTLLTLHALAAHVQMIVLGGFIWLTYLAYMTVAGAGNGCGRWRFVLGGSGACFLGAMGSLPQILPMFEVSRWSGYGQYNPDFFNSGYLKFRFLVGLAGPWVLGRNFGASSPSGYWGLAEHGIFYGVIPLTAALVAIIWFFLRKGLERQGDRETRRSGEKAVSLSPCLRVSLSSGRVICLPTKQETGFWLVLFFESLVLMLGKTLPVHYLLAYLPIYHFFHMPTRHVWAMGLALAWLAGLGLDLLRNLEATFRMQLLTRLGVTLLVLAGIYVILIRSGAWPDRPGWNYPGFWIPVISALASFVVLLTLARVKLFHVWLAAAVPLLAFLELALTIHDFELAPVSTAALTEPAEFPKVVQWLRKREPINLPPRCLIRREAWMVKGDSLMVPLGFGSAWGLSSVNYYTETAPRSLSRIVQLDAYASADFGGLLAEERGLSAAAGRYILARGPLAPFAPGLGDLAELPSELVWKEDDRSPGHPSPLTAGTVHDQASTLVASLVTMPDQTYLVEGVLPGQGPRQGTARIVRTTRPSADTLGEMTFMSSDYQPASPSAPDSHWERGRKRLSTGRVLVPKLSLGTRTRPGGIHFACVFQSGQLSGSFWISLECQDGAALLPPEIKIWHLTAEYGKSALDADPREVARKLHSGLRQPYPVLASFPDDLRVYENPLARALAGFVKEVRPAASDMEAAERITAPGPPVRDLAYIVAPGGRSQGWDLSGPSFFEEGGAAELYCRRPDDLTVYTLNRGEGFLVLAVTRCLGWSATIDGKKVPIHAVDGPFMGVRVPAGEHTIRFRFRPVLMWAGSLVAGLFFSGAWIVVIVGAIRGRRRAPGGPASISARFAKAA